MFVEYVCREDINLHYNQTMTYSKKCDCVNDEQQVVEFILKNVAIAGDTVQSALIDQQEQFYGDHFKRVRRQLPITRAKMDWYSIYDSILIIPFPFRNKFAAYRLKGDLNAVNRG